MSSSISPPSRSPSLLKAVAKVTFYMSIASALLAISFQANIMATTGTFTWRALTSHQARFMGFAIGLSIGSGVIHMITDCAARKRERKEQAESILGIQHNVNYQTFPE
ncbi:MAG: hypothetical protein K940chlam9_01007 [Chlamydiae bacterium]|nr:hypothetical protein [Chlamydiota bacterium]